jgi:omega-6 fatty acid desaturase (delta-12 desaturase)
MDKPAWTTIVAPYQRSSTTRALVAAHDYADSVRSDLVRHLPCIDSIALARNAAGSPGGGFLVRLFIIFHDCGHGSYFSSRRANDIVGRITGALTFTPYDHWRWQHAIHHGTAGHLDKRGTGDIWTMTVQEYLDASRWRRFAYRLARNPLVLFVLAPFYLFLVNHRLPAANAGRRQRRSVWWMNAVLLGTAAAMSWIFGLGPYLLIQSTITWWRALRESGSSTCSISSRMLTGSAATSGTTRRRRCAAARTTSYRTCCSGSRPVSASITSIT